MPEGDEVVRILKSLKNTHIIWAEQRGDALDIQLENGMIMHIEGRIGSRGVDISFKYGKEE